MERLTGRWPCGLANYPENNLPQIIDRLAEIEDILDDTYDLERLREAIDKKDEYERFIKQWEQMAEIAGAVKKVGAERVAELVEADKQGRALIVTDEMATAMRAGALVLCHKGSKKVNWSRA